MPDAAEETFGRNHDSAAGRFRPDLLRKLPPTSNRPTNSFERVVPYMSLTDRQVRKQARTTFDRELNSVRTRDKARGGGARGDRTTYLYNGINYSSGSKLRLPAPPKLYSNINFDEEKPFWEHLIKIRQNHNWKFSSRREEERCAGGGRLRYLLSRGINSGQSLNWVVLNWRRHNILSSVSLKLSATLHIEQWV